MPATAEADLLSLIEDVADDATAEEAAFLLALLEESTEEELDRLLFDARPETPDELHLWIQNFIGVNIPRHRCCPDHVAPFEVVANCFFEHPDWLNLLLIANRGGGKTLNTAILDVLEMKFKECGVVSIGAIREQANKAGAYVDEILEKPEFAADLDAGSGASKKALTTGGTLQVIPCTMAQCNGPHEPKVNIDEFELADPAALEEAKSIPMTDRRGNRAALRMFSTRKFAFGNVQKEIESAHEKGVKVVAYCYKEVTETCPDDRSGNKLVTVWVDRDNLDWKADADYQALPPKSRAEYEAYDVYDGCLSCPLVATCRGDLKNASGWMPIDDVIRAFRRHSVEMWLAQWEGRKPNPKGKIYKLFLDERNVTDAFDFDPRFPVIWTKDWGYSDPDVTLLIQHQEDRIVVVDELYLVEHDTNQIKQYLNDYWVPKYGLPSMVYADPSGANECAIFKKVNPEIPGDIKYRINQRGAPVLDGVDEVRKVIRPLDGPRTRLYVHPRCRQFIHEMGLYHYKLNRDGTPTEAPEHEYSHGPDAFRYFVWNGLKGFRMQVA